MFHSITAFHTQNASSEKEIQTYLEIITCDPSINTMACPLWIITLINCINIYGNFISTDKPKALKYDCIYNIDMLFWKKGFTHLFTFTVKALINTAVPV